MSKKAFITGITGQDGSYLAELLLEKDYEVHGLIRRTASYEMKNIEHIRDSLKLYWGDLETEHHLCSLLQKIQPEEVYNLASQSDVRLSFDIPEYTGNVTGLGVTRLLEAVRMFSPKSRLYQASSSEMYGCTAPPHHEEVMMRPRNPYAAAKLYAYHMVQIYRESYGIFASNGILFNHESPRRGINFVTRKIVRAAVKISRGEQNVLYLGNLDSKRDWGYAPDYVRAMWLMLQQETPGDFVIGTGEAHTVRDFVEVAFRHVELNWENFVKIDPKFFRPTETHYLCSLPEKAEKELGWKPRVSFDELVKLMIEAELEE